PCEARLLQAFRSPIFGAPCAPVAWQLAHTFSTTSLPLRSAACASMHGAAIANAAATTNRIIELSKGHRPFDPSLPIGHKKSWPGPAFMAQPARYFAASAASTAAFSSASEPAILAWPLPSLILATSIACASLLPLCLAATSLNAGPTFFLSISWQPRQPFAFSTSGACSIPPASTPEATTTARIAFIAYLESWLDGNCVSLRLSVSLTQPDASR